MLATLSVGLTLLSLAVTAWLFVRYPGVLVAGVANTDPKGHVDFETFWRSTVALLHGGDVYRTGSVLPNLNPPLLSLLLAPFGLLADLPSYWAFTALTIAVVTGSVLLAARELRFNRSATAFALVTMLACSPLHGTLLLGQIYGLLLAGLTAAWLAQRRGRSALAAVLLGVTVALKPSLAPVLVIPAMQRRWRATAIGVGSAALSSLLGVLVAGPVSAWEWVRLATGTPAPGVDANASLPGLVARLDGPGWLGWLITITVVAGSLYAVRRARPTARAPGQVGPDDAAIFAVVAGCLLAAPIAWLNYLVMLWPGALALVRGGRWRSAVPLLVLTVVPVAWGNLWRSAPHTPAALAGRSLYCVVLLGFWVALLALAGSSATRLGYRARPFEPGSTARAGEREAAGAEAAGSPRSHSTPLGGTRSTADAGRPCHG
jgi:arabinofuranan 3-O-arabinosyltransferase